MNHPGWLLVAIGSVIVVLGLVWVAAAQLPWFGKLPGDLVYQGKSTRVYFPVVTCLLLSGLLTLVIWIASRLR